MALRNLVARMRTPAAAALRLPPPAPRVSPPAGARPRFYSSTEGGKGLNLESASDEEIRRQVEWMAKEIVETKERLSSHHESIPDIWKDIYGTAKLWVVAGAAIETLLLGTSWLSTATEDEAEKFRTRPSCLICQH